MKRVAIIQSAYVPWRGFFDLIGRCDEYIVYDSVQFSKGHWHNRNQIKTKSGLRWLTISVETAGRLGQRIDEVVIAKPWAELHWGAIEEAYRGAPAFNEVTPTIKGLYERAATLPLLTDVNLLFLESLSDMLGLRTHIVRDSVYPSDGRRTERLIEMLKAAGATHYLSGPSARAYIEEDKFEAAGIRLEWMEYGPYPDYSQLHGGFEPAVSVIDLLFNCGDQARELIHPAKAPA